MNIFVFLADYVNDNLVVLLFIISINTTTIVFILNYSLRFKNATSVYNFYQ